MVGVKLRKQQKATVASLESGRRTDCSQDACEAEQCQGCGDGEAGGEAA